MNTIYWITRFDNINNAAWIIFSIATGIFLVVFIIHVIDLWDDEKAENLGKSIMKTSSIVGVICLIFGIFVPTTKEAIVIYGGGKILEYVESNEKIQNMPDKVIDLTDHYIDSLNKELENTNKEE